MSHVLQDLRLALRQLHQSPGLSAAAIVTIALGIGANATIYSFVHAVLFRPLDVPAADRLVHVSERREGPGAFPLSLAEYPSYREAARSFEALAAHYSTAPLHASIAGSPEALTGAVVTASYFEVLQIRPALGRFFTAEEDRVRDRDAVAVISYGSWQRHFGGGADAIGSTIRLNDRLFTIVGVAPPRFTGVQVRGSVIDVWIPSALFGVGYRYCDAFAADCTIVQMIGRLRTGVSPQQAARELDDIAGRLPAEPMKQRRRIGMSVEPARGIGAAPGSSERRQLNLFLAAVTLVFIVTCANIAGLLLARAAARRRQMAVRLALGASRTRVLSQVLAETAVLAVLGGGAGLLAAAWGTSVLEALYAQDSAGRAMTFDLSLAWPVVLAAAGLTVLAALLAGGIPAWLASRTEVGSVLKQEGGSGGRRRMYLRQSLVCAQLAMSMVLLVGAGMLIASAQSVMHGPGFDPGQVLTLRLRPSLVNYSRERAERFHREVTARLEALPGVVSASPSVYMAMFGGGPRSAVRDPTQSREAVDATRNFVGAQYFATLGIGIVEGREFAETDRRGAATVAIVNDVLARQLSPDRSLVGREVAVDGGTHTIVGVVRDAQYYAAGETPRGQIFFSYWQSDGNDAFLADSRTFVKVSGDPRAVLADVRRAIAAVDPSVPISEAHALGDRVAYMFQPLHVARLLLTVFAVLALVLATVGLYGVLAQSIAQRTREIGVRVAIGATRRDITVLVFREAFTLIATGVGLGLLAAWYSTRLLQSLLFGVASRDPLSFAVAPVAVVVIGLIASYLPARRAARVSPLSAMRVE
jgi:predicted permease